MLIDFIQQIFNGLVVGSIYTLIALGLTTIFGILGIAHFAHGSVAMFGGYLTYFLISALGIGLLPSFILAMAVGALLGVVLERVAYYPVRNAPPINSFIIALGLTLIIEKLNLLAFGIDQVIIPTPFVNVINIGGVTMPELRIYVLVIAAILVIGMTLLIQRTWIGMAVRAVAQNRVAAVLMGINVNSVSMFVFALSSALGVAAGVLVGALFAVAPGVSSGLVIKGFAVLILGGLGSIPGAIVGGMVLGVSEAFAAAFVSSAYKDVISFLLMILVLLVRPEGLMRRSSR
ncbi:MAG: branched-chain amino acid ABC transporter permease [Afipia sp.]|jgi:branched-chain amino acid transport system permease protein|uniref:Branched-chain amino acid transport system permease protein n=1 Tax=Afipia massiliensis TaxID=211460 RepID=A0A840N1W9_9BRAD|nr:branched-chain amino acid ABC transporter permease [Afipia massiliensis]MBB5054063.1 branched-chain amino acid transport system permease protein [Afipia massiliensis]MDO8981875.1 branched-chain amino acid ABC transporter permease [Afipia sp.]